MDKKIRFQGKEYLLIGGDLQAGGPIATPEQFANFECSYAYLLPNGTVIRCGDSIGHRDEIEVLGEATAEGPDLLKVLDVLSSPDMGGWLGRKVTR